MSNLILDVDQVGELIAAFGRGGWTNAEIKTFCEGNNAALALQFLRDGCEFVVKEASSLIIEIDYDQPELFETLVAAGGYDWRNTYLNGQNFPIKGSGKKCFECKLFDANCSSEDGVKRITNKDKTNPWKPGKVEHTLAFGAAFPNLQLKHPIVGLGSFARVGRYIDFPSLHRSDARRGLDLSFLGRAWPGHWRLLGVRELSESVA